MQSDRWLSQGDIARELGRSPSTIANWRNKLPAWTRPRQERHGAVYSLNRMAEIAQLMDVRPRLSARELERIMTERHGDGEPSDIPQPAPDPVLSALAAILAELQAIREALERLAASG